MRGHPEGMGVGMNIAWEGIARRYSRNTSKSHKAVIETDEVPAVRRAINYSPGRGAIYEHFISFHQDTQMIPIIIIQLSQKAARSQNIKRPNSNRPQSVLRML